MSLEKLKLTELIKNWVNGTVNFHDVLQNKEADKNNLFDKEALSILLSEDVFFSIKDKDGESFVWKFYDFMSNAAILSIQVQNSFFNLINLLKEQIESPNTDWQNHQNLCIVMQCILELDYSNNENCIDALVEDVIDCITDYFCKLLNKCNHTKTVTMAIQTLLKFSSSKINRVIKKASDLVSAEHNGTNFCQLIDTILKWKTSLLINEQVVINSFAYFLKIFGQCNHLKSILMAILSAEKLFIQEKSKIGEKQTEDFLKSKFVENWRRNSIILENENENSHMRYQIELCVHWACDKIFNWQNPLDKIPLVKISPDLFSVRNDGLKYRFPTILSAFLTVKLTRSSVFYYEAILLTVGEMRFGWATREANLSKDDAIGSDIYSIGLDVSQMTMYHNVNKQGKPFQTSLELHDRKIGDVVGCLIDVSNRRFIFYINGEEIKCQKEIHFSSSPYSAAASIATNQHCYFNFGQMAFKYPPNNIDFIDFKRCTLGDIKKYGLMDINEANDKFWFKQEVVDNYIVPFYQAKSWTRETIEQSLKNCESYDEYECLKNIQMIIESLDMNDHDVEIQAESICRLFDKILPKISQVKLCKIFYPYLQAKIINETDIIKHRKICICLLHIIQFDKNQLKIIDSIRNEIFNYLRETLFETSDIWTELFAIICFENFEMNSDEKQSLYKTDDLKILKKTNDFKRFICKENIIELLTNEKFSKIEYQVMSSCQYLYDQVLQNYSQDGVEIPYNVALDKEDKTEHLKLSPNQLSARSDFNWQSVRSMFVCKKDIYYFEVLLITGGPMRIGWATKRTDLSRVQVGGDEFSIGFDGFSQCIWHENKQLKLNICNQWKVGNIVGCLINIDEKRFTFTLNGVQLDLSENYYFSTFPYCAAISLSSHQQVYINFGQTAFKYPPNRVDYKDFCNSCVDDRGTSTSSASKLISQYHNLSKLIGTQESMHLNHNNIVHKIINIFIQVQDIDLLIAENEQFKKRIVVLQEEINNVKATKFDEIVNKLGIRIQLSTSKFQSV